MPMLEPNTNTAQKPKERPELDLAGVYEVDMGVTINYTKGSGKAHLNRRLSKQQLEERREKQQLAQHKIEEAVRRAQRSTTGASVSPTRRTLSSNLNTITTNRQWAFSHARRERDRRMRGGVMYRSSSTSAYAPVRSENLEKKKQQLLATMDWASLSRSNSPHSRSRSRSQSFAIMEEDPYPAPKVRVESFSTASRTRVSPTGHYVHMARVQALSPIQDMGAAKSNAADSSLTDIDMPSSPPKCEATLSISIKSTISSSVRNDGLSSSIQSFSEPNIKHEEAEITIRNEPEEDHKPSSQELTAIMSSQVSVATYGTSRVNSVKEEIVDEKTISELEARPLEPNHIRAGLQYLGEAFKNVRHIRDLQCQPMVLNCLLPCMSGDCNPPFVYDGVPRSSDYLGMAFAGPDMDI